MTSSSSASRSIGRARVVRCWRALTFALQPSNWSWKSSSLGEHAPGLEVGLRVALPALDDALGLRIALAAEMPADPQLAAEGGELRRRAALVGVDAGLAVPDQRLRQP